MSQKIQVKFFAVILALAFSATAQAEFPIVEWTRQLGTAAGDSGNGASLDGSGNVYVTGRTGDGLDGNTSAGLDDMFLTKYNTDGDKLWTRQLGTNSTDRGYGVSVDGSGNAYVAGLTTGGLDGNTFAGHVDMFLTKYDSDGAKLWTRQLGTDGGDEGYGISVDGSGNAYVTGCTNGGLDGNTSAGYYDMFLTKYDTDGAKLWTKQLGTDSADYGNGVSVDSSGNAYVTGYTKGSLDGNTSSGGEDMFLTKYNMDGDKLWTTQLGTDSSDRGLGVSLDGNGNAYVTGLTGGGLDGNISEGDWDMFIAKCNPAGVKLWTRQLGTASDDSGQGISIDSSGSVYVTGITKGALDGNTYAGNGDIFLTKYDTDGTKLWIQQLGTTGYDRGDGVSVDSSGNAYVTGHTYGGLDGNTNAGSFDMFIVKISSIPEPGSIAMLAGMALTALLYRKRKHV